jgi:hypothetical protein
MLGDGTKRTCVDSGFLSAATATTSQRGCEQMNMYCRVLPLVSLTLVLALGSCAMNAGGYRSVSAVRDRLIGMSKEDVAVRLGAPTESMALSPGAEVWTYRTGSIGLTGGQCVVVVTFKNNVASDAKINKTDMSPLVAPLGSCQSIIGNLD